MKYYNTAQQAVENITKQSYFTYKQQRQHPLLTKAVSERHRTYKY
jgi:hypothetical protein